MHRILSYSSIILLLAGSVQAGTGSASATWSIGNVNKKTVMKTGTLKTTALTASQIVLTYTVTAGSTFFLMGGDINASQDLPSAGLVSLNMGSVWWESPSGTAISSYTFIQSSMTYSGPRVLPTFAEGIPITQGTVIRAVVTPNTTTAINWIANFYGYEK